MIKPVKTKKSYKGYKEGKVVKFDNKFYVEYNKELYHPDIVLNDDKITLYALPSNNYHDIGFATLIDTVSFKSNKDMILRSWHYVKSDMKVKGDIEDDKFIINFKL